MIILGYEYTFLEIEKQKLEKKFGSLHFINYEKQDSQLTLRNIMKTAKEENISHIVLNISSSPDEKIVNALTKLNVEQNVRFTTIEHFLEKYLGKCYIPNVYKDLHYLEDIKSFTSFQYLQKRVIDYLSVITLLTLSAPVMLYSRYKTKQQSPGSTFFIQPRVGKNNKDFNCMKFRSMHENSKHDPYTRENDPRIFAWGETMRKTRIDELPQLLNVLKGEMHLIGPRAEWNILVKEYENQLPYYNERHLVRPGITGWAQVNYPYGQNIEDTKQKLMYDLYYIKYWNIGLEIKVIWKTIMTVLGKKGL